jgi:secernin
MSNLRRLLSSPNGQRRQSRSLTIGVASACDSIVALPDATSAGITLFAKNSDRMPADECQPLYPIAAGQHEAGSRVQCQYIEIEQVRHTHALLLSRPYWLWGGEHGVNEHAVAIGNQTIFTRDPVAATGLCGMDLVRLGLERAERAEAAVEIIIGLIERYGQGGSGFVHVDWPYHNSFLIADPSEAWLLEISATNWAARRIERWGAATNHVTIGTNWTRLSPGCRDHAIKEDRLLESGGRVDFAGSYRDSVTIPPAVSSGRYAASTAALAARDGRLELRDFQRIMRDHYESGEIYRPGAAPEDERFFCLCRHDEAGPTTASMVAELSDPAQTAVLCRVAFGNPCLAPYIPVFPAGRIPVEMTSGGRDVDSGGAWWRFKRLVDRVADDYESHGPQVRDRWRPLEIELEEAALELRARIGGDIDTASRIQLGDFMAEAWKRVSVELDGLLAELS